jgi:farnesyl-diphosphate farnesyltransferase
MADHPSQELLRDLLRQVSRSFYLSLKWLPARVREPISLAYLLARTSDTIADTAWIPAKQRLSALETFAASITDQDAAPIDFAALASGQGDPAEGLLLNRAPDSLALLKQLSREDRTLVGTVLATIISGQMLDLKRFAAASRSHIVALEDAAELEDYIYRVAGCVGEFWTRICFRHLTPECTLSEEEMIELGTRYGRGLQLVNILRDLPRDLHQGRCYLPRKQLLTIDLDPSALLDPDRESELRPVYDAWLDRARSFLADGWRYTNAYPRRLARVRISCALPILIGRQTLDRLATGRILDPGSRIKVSRREVRRLVVRTVVRHPFESLWRGLGTA